MVTHFKLVKKNSNGQSKSANFKFEEGYVQDLKNITYLISGQYAPNRFRAVAVLYSFYFHF